MKLKSLVLALIAVISASAMAEPASCNISVSWKGSTVATIGALADITTVSCQIPANDNAALYKAAFRLYRSNSTYSAATLMSTCAWNTSGRKYSITANDANQRELNGIFPAVLVQVNTCIADRAIEDAAAGEVQACATAMDKLKATKLSITAATTLAEVTAIVVPTCPTTTCDGCSVLKAEVDKLKETRTSELSGRTEDIGLKAWEAKFAALKSTDSPVVDGVDLLASLKTIKDGFKQDKNKAKVAELEKLVKNKFTKPCFNAKFTSTQQTQSDALEGLEELKDTYTLDEVKTIVNNADYYNTLAVSTSGGDVIKDHVSICALVWVITGYNKSVGNDFDKREALAELLVTKFGDDGDGLVLLTGIGGKSIAKVLSALDKGTKNIDTSSIDPVLIAQQITGEMANYKAPTTEQTSAEFGSWVDEEFVADVNGDIIVDTDNIQTLVSSLLKLTSYEEASLEVVVTTLLEKFGSKGDNYDANKLAIKNAILAAHKDGSVANVEALVNALIENTESIKASDLGYGSGIDYIVDQVIKDAKETPVVNDKVDPATDDDDENNTTDKKQSTGTLDDVKKSVVKDDVVVDEDEAPVTKTKVQRYGTLEQVKAVVKDQVVVDEDK